MNPPASHANRDLGSARTIVTAVVAAVAVVLAAVWFGPSFLRNPFGTETVDYSAPLVLTELRDLADFHAAQASFEVVIDQEDDVNLLPSFIAGERVQYVAVGYVDGIVNFETLDESAIEIDQETNAVKITLPQPYIGEPVIDIEQSHVMNRDRGVLDRLGAVFEDNPTSEQALIKTAQEKMRAGAVQTDLLERASINTTKMLESLLGTVGFDTVTVSYQST